MKDATTAIRLTINTDIRQALDKARRRYPTLSEAEIFKLGLAILVGSDERTSMVREKNEIRVVAARAVGYDYLADEGEDLYSETSGSPISF